MLVIQVFKDWYVMYLLSFPDVHITKSSTCKILWTLGQIRPCFHEFSPSAGTSYAPNMSETDTSQSGFPQPQ